MTSPSKNPGGEPEHTRHTRITQFHRRTSQPTRPTNAHAGPRHDPGNHGEWFQLANYARRDAQIFACTPKDGASRLSTTASRFLDSASRLSTTSSMLSTTYLSSDSAVHCCSIDRASFELIGTGTSVCTGRSCYCRASGASIITHLGDCELTSHASG